MNEPVPLTYGIAHLGGAYTVCIEDRVVAEGLTSVPFDDPDCPARNAARIVRETCAELTGADPGEPLVLDLKPLCWLVDDEIEASGRRPEFHPCTVGADTGYASKACAAAVRERGVTPHVAQNTYRRQPSASDGRTTRQLGDAVSQHERERVEEIFGWGKRVGGMRRTRFVGLAKTQQAMLLIGAASSVV